MILITCSSTNRNTYSIADEINLLAAANGFSNPANEREEAQYLDWFKDQIQSCGPEIAAELGFNSQPPEGGWFPFDVDAVAEHVSTHSRPKAAGWI